MFSLKPHIYMQNHKERTDKVTKKRIHPFLAKTWRVMLLMLGLLAMSTWYASSNARSIAVRKVFGSTVDNEVRRNARSFMLMTLIAAAVAIPISVVIVRKLLETEAERITGTWWIYVAATLLILAVAYVSVLWQTLKAARTNPAVELKKE